MNFLTTPVLLTVSGLIAALVSYKVIYDINHDTSSTAAIGYIFVPFIFGLVFAAGAAFLWSINRFIFVLRGEHTFAQPGSIAAIIVLLFFTIFTFVVIDILYFTSTKRSTLQLQSLYNRYKSIPIIGSWALADILQHPRPPLDLLEQEIKNSNYQASKNPGIPGDLLEKLISEIPADNWGILCNLAAHKNLTEKSIQLLLQKKDGPFVDESNRTSYTECVLGQLRFHESTPEKLRNQLKKQLGYE